MDAHAVRAVLHWREQRGGGGGRGALALQLPWLSTGTAGATRSPTRLRMTGTRRCARQQLFEPSICAILLPPCRHAPLPSAELERYQELSRAMTSLNGYSHGGDWEGVGHTPTGT